MANAILGTKNRASAATYSGGSWSSTLPITNLATTDVTQVARTSSAALANTRFRADLGANYTLRCFGLINHSLSTAGTWRVRAGTAGLDVDFTSGMQGDDRITITGGGSGRYHVGSDGLLTLSAGGKRLSYNPVTLASEGVLFESAGTNLFLYSDFSSSWLFSSGGSFASTTTGPDGTASGKVLNDPNVGNAGYTYKSVSFTSGSVYTLSVWVKPVGVTSMSLRSFTQAGSAVFNCVGDGSTGAVSGIASAPKIKKHINGWYRCSVTLTASATGGNNAGFSTESASFTGDAFALWGPQCQPGALSTYIPTTSAAITATADSVGVISGATFTALHSATGGTLYVEFCPLNTSPGVGAMICLDNGTLNEWIEMYTASNQVGLIVADGGVTQADLATTVAAGTTYKFAAAWTGNSVRTCLSGGAVAADTSASLPTVDRMRLAADPGGNGGRMALKRITWWPTPLTDAQLQSITTTSPDALGYSSGWVDADRLTWHEDVPAAWGGIYPLVEPFTTAISARYITFEASDTTNAAGYLDFGRPFIGDALQATYNISYGMADGLEDLSGRAVSPAGKVYGTSRRPRRNVTAQLDWLSQPEADRIHEVMLNARTLGELLWVPDPADAALAQRYGMLCTLRELPQVGYPMYAIRNWQFALEEIL